MVRDRFKDAPWFPKTDVPVIIGGAGGIGSWLAVMLARAGFKPIVYDFDLIEQHNIGGQLFTVTSVGKSKTAEIFNVVNMFTGEQITTLDEKVVEDTMSNPVVFSAFDNMEARKHLFQRWVSLFSHLPESIFIDGRLQAEHMQILCVRGGETFASQREEYAKEYLFGDAEVEDAPCTMKQTSHSAAMIASHMTAFFTNHYTNVVEKDNTRVVPFFWEYFIPIDLITTKE